jgi:hypothetical protein
VNHTVAFQHLMMSSQQFPSSLSNFKMRYAVSPESALM